MGACSSKPSTLDPNLSDHHQSVHENNPIPLKDSPNPVKDKLEIPLGKKSPFFPFYSPSPAHYLFSKKSPARSPTSNSTPKRLFRRPFPPPSPAKHIRSLLARRHGSVKPNEASIPEGNETDGGNVSGLDKSFGFSKHFGNKYELGDEVGRGHFGYTCKAMFKKGELEGQEVAVKVIPKAKVSQFSLLVLSSLYLSLLMHEFVFLG